MADLILSLQITTLGMSLVFGAILLLWLMMVLLTRFTADASASLSQNSASNAPAPAPPPATRSGDSPFPAWGSVPPPGVRT